MELLTKAIEKKLRAQHIATEKAGGANLHHKPVVRFFGGSSFTMLASEMLAQRASAVRVKARGAR